jgi:23S rRNA pseudouridine2605 synthase
MLLRLDRLIVERGWCGRKEAQRLIRRGHVRVEGAEVTSIDAKVPPEARVEVDGEPCAAPPALIAYHKPLHQLSALRDPWGRAGLDYALPARWREAMHPVGRLDSDTTGLLLFSSDGALTQRLLHPRRAVERAYVAAVAALPDDLGARLEGGVETALGVFTGRLERRSEGVSAALFSALEAGVSAAGEVQVAVTEGKHRMVRRMLHNAGASVLALHRVRFGSVELGGLAVGEWRALEEGEVLSLLSSLG